MSIEDQIRGMLKRGEWADFRHLQPPPLVDATFVRQLLLEQKMMGEDSPSPLLPVGVRIRGVSIQGSLDLSDMGDEDSPLKPLCLENSTIPEPIVLNGARLSRLSLKYSEIEFLDATDAVILGPISIVGVRPARTNCRVLLWNTTVRGSVEADAAQLVAPYFKHALDATLAVIGGSLYLRNGFTAKGHVRLQNTEIRKTLDVSNAKFENPSHTALSLERCKVGASFLLRHATTIIGRLSALGCTVEGNIEFVGASLTNPSATALSLNGSKIGGNVLFVPEHDARGEQRRTLCCGDLKMERLSCAGAVRIDGLDLTAEQLAGRDPQPATLSLQDAQVEHLRLLDLSCSGPTVFDARNLSVRVLEDDLERGWGSPETPLRLDGLSYGRLSVPGGNAKRAVSDARIDWLRRGHAATAYLPQPYQHLARTLSSQGYQEAARQIRVSAKVHELSTRTPLILRPFVAFYWLAFEFGYSSARALITLTVCVLIGWLATWSALRTNILVVDTLPVASLADRSGALGVEIADGRPLRNSTPCGTTIDPLYYALDLFIPLVDFNQERRCDIASNAPSSAFWRLAKNLYTLLGWIVVSLAITTFSGAVSRARDD